MRRPAEGASSAEPVVTAVADRVTRWARGALASSERPWHLHGVFRSVLRFAAIVSLVGCHAIGEDHGCITEEVVVPERADATGEVELLVAAEGVPLVSSPSIVRGHSRGGSVAIAGAPPSGGAARGATDMVATMTWKLAADPSTPLELPMLVQVCRRTTERIHESGLGCIDGDGARSSAEQRLVFGHLVWWGEHAYSIHVDEPRLRMRLAVSWIPPVTRCREL